MKFSPRSTVFDAVRSRSFLLISAVTECFDFANNHVAELWFRGFRVPQPTPQPPKCELRTVNIQPLVMIYYFQNERFYSRFSCGIFSFDNQLYFLMLVFKFSQSIIFLKLNDLIMGVFPLCP